MEVETTVFDECIPGDVSLYSTDRAYIHESPLLTSHETQPTTSEAHRGDNRLTGAIPRAISALAITAHRQHHLHATNALVASRIGGLSRRQTFQVRYDSDTERE